MKDAIALLRRARPCLDDPELTAEVDALLKAEDARVAEEEARRKREIWSDMTEDARQGFREMFKSHWDKMHAQPVNDLGSLGSFAVLIFLNEPLESRLVELRGETIAEFRTKRPVKFVYSHTIDEWRIEPGTGKEPWYCHIS